MNQFSYVAVVPQVHRFLLLWLTLSALASSLSAGESFPAPFVRVPMAESSRSIVVPLGHDLHLAWDVDYLRTHTVWKGGPVTLEGPPHTGRKTPYLSKYQGDRLWGNPPILPLTQEQHEPSGIFSGKSDFSGIRLNGNQVTFVYQVGLKEGSVEVHMSPRCTIIAGQPVVIRTFTVQPAAVPLRLLAHATEGKPIDLETSVAHSVSIQREEGRLLAWIEGNSQVEWQCEVAKVRYPVTRYVESGADSSLETTMVNRDESRAWVTIPAHKDPLVFQVATAVLATAAEVTSFTAEFHAISGNRIEPENPAKNKTARIFKSEPGPYYRTGQRGRFRIERFWVPREIDLLVGGIDWLPDGGLAVATWPGEIYIVEEATGPIEQATFRLFATGLDQPLGLRVVDGEILVVQRCELTRVSDTDGDGLADWYESVNDDWGYSGNYHSYAFGPMIDGQGRFYVGLTGHRGLYEHKYTGWWARIAPDGSAIEGFCHGFRTPNGFGTYRGDLFCTDNQGNWIGTSKLNHLGEGAFYGYPSGKPAMPKEQQVERPWKQPALYIPRSWSPSASDIAEIPAGTFGPFEGQLLIGEFQNGTVLRAALEKVEGQWQGAVWPMMKGFVGAVNRLSFGPDGKLYVGGCKRAWSTAAPLEYSLERVTFTGEAGFEILEAHVKPDGFELIFTRPVDELEAGDPENYDVLQHRYRYSSSYGSPEIDFEGNENNASPVTVVDAVVLDNGKRVRLKLDGWREGYVTMVRSLARDREGHRLENDTFYYTLNRIPDS